MKFIVYHHISSHVVLCFVPNHKGRGLEEKEKEAIYCIAEIMGVSKERVEAMMEIVAEEEELKKKRIAACIPNHPCLAPEYK